MTEEMLSAREFARRDGCDEARVRRGVQRGELPARPDRRLPASLAGTAWRKGNRAAADATTKAAPIPKPVEPTDDGAPISLAEAVRRREIALAGLKRHELAALRAKWAQREEVEGAWRQVFELARARLSLLPSQAAEELALCSSIPRIQTALTDFVYSALTELAETDLAVTCLDDDAEPLELPDDATLIEAETAKVTAQGSIRRLEIDIAAGRLVQLDEVEEAGSRVLVVARQRMLAIAGTMPPRLLGRPANQVEALIRKAVVEALDELEDGLLPGSRQARTAKAKRKRAG